MKTIGALVFEGFELLDLFGPLEFFNMLEDDYKVRIIAEGTDPVQSNRKGPISVVDEPISAGNSYDILLIPGGHGTRREVDNAALMSWLRDAHSKATWTASVCTGSALLAKAGILDGRKATSNKSAFSWVNSQGPNVDWQAKARWTEDGDIFTSSGVSAGMDMALALIARDLGQEIAEQVAIWGEYHWHSDPSDDPFAVHHGLA